MTETGSAAQQPSAADCYALDILSALGAAPERVAVHWRGREVRAGALARSVVDTVQTLRKLGIGPGTTVAVLVAPNSPLMLTVRWATHLLGGAVMYVRGTNPGSTAYVLSADEQLRILFDATAQVLFTDGENADRAAELAQRAPGRFTVAEGDSALTDEGGVASAAELVAELGELPVRDPRQYALVSFSSGSTGKPKGVCITTAVNDARARALPAEPGTRLLVATPLAFVVGGIADAVLLADGVVVLHEGFEAVAVARAIAEHGITLTFMATPHVYQTMAAVQAEGTDLASLKALIYTGVAAAPAKLAEAVQVFGPVLVQMYGSTEAGAVSILLPDGHYDPRLRATVGRPLPGVEISVRDAESGAELPAGETGELWVRSGSLLDAYLGDPALTARTLRDGWFLTGDIGRLDEEGLLSLADRIADVVKIDGVKIYPAAVEREIATLAGVANVAVYGVRDLDNLEHVHAAVALKPQARLSHEEIRAHVGAALSAAHAPEETRFLDELPLGVSGKPDKRLLRELYPIV
ncbi:AMP-binding protein [Kitasatospora sp. NBC_01250]|uniref:class I adenylate-forming enzyme family protein n=1 Tax=unclassified Kitasatospora TaxID=2633591 RepID=UPI002E118FB2|nr:MULTISPECIES: AMP-binding protein [unclassified Kitasatospora]WSJ71110.1 AMP-binding protein [Kitasatospora sp. NBC_01302]